MENLLIKREEIERAVSLPELIDVMEEAFKKHSSGRSVVPPVGNLFFEKHGGEVHIKSGYMKDEEFYVVKIASHFKGNKERGIALGNGAMLLFCQKTGRLAAILHDEGYLTDIRTAAAGALAARLLAPKSVRSIGIVGTGRQALLQLRMLEYVTDCRDVVVFGRSKDGVEKFLAANEASAFRIKPTESLRRLVSSCNLIVTTTSADKPLIMAEDLQEGTHITGVGADSPGKHEIDPEVFRKAAVVAVDSKSQCFAFGDTSHALKSHAIKEKDVVEIGEIAANKLLGRKSEKDITVADLTGVAVQDIAAAESVYRKIRGGSCKR